MLTMTESERRFHEHFMRIALREAEASAAAGEVPCGCVIVMAPEGVFEPGIAHPPTLSDPWSAKILAKAHNQTELLNDPTAHAEMIAITAATATIGDWRLKNAIVYVTKEPCPMCAGALIWARPEMIVWGLSDKERGGEHEFGILSSKKVNHHPILLPGILEEVCREQFVDFFKTKRKES
jgi:tRNA(adenine34) deaminase